MLAFLWSIQNSVCCGIECAAADNAMTAKDPDIPDLADGLTCYRFRHDVGRPVEIQIERFDPQVDFGHLEARHLYIEIQIDQRQFGNLLHQHLIVQLGILCETGFGNGKSSFLCLAQVCHLDSRHLGEAQDRAPR
jgi:hypothetical protein